MRRSRSAARKGKATARERIEAFLDPGSFTETDALTKHRARDFGMEAKQPIGDGVITGYGTVDGRPVCVFSQDAMVFGGALGEVYGEKIVKVMDLALKNGCPIVGLNEGSGARIQEGIMGLALYGDIFYRNVLASGVIPQISLILGNCAGGHVYSPALTDFNLMVDGSSAMMITGPDVIKTVTGEDITIEDLGGARAHNSKSGVAHFMSHDEEEALELAKLLLSYLPSNNLDDGAGPRRVRRADRGAAVRARHDHPGQQQRAVRHEGDHHRRPRRRRLPRGAGSCGRRRSSPASAGSRAAASASSPTTRCSSPAPSTSTRPRRPRGSCAPATRSTCRC